jgi:hypothetical protein
MNMECVIYSIYFFLYLQFKNIKIKTYRTQTVCVVLFGCESWSFVLWEKYRLRVLEYRFLRLIFRPNWEVVTGGWRKAHSEELFIFAYILLWCSNHGVYVAHTRGKRHSYRVLVDKREGRRPLGRLQYG